MDRFSGDLDGGDAPNLELSGKLESCTCKGENGQLYPPYFCYSSACMSEDSPKVVLTIAGFDPSSGAGVTADLKTISAHRLYGVACITALTVQSTQGVRRIQPVDPKLVRDTLECLVDDVRPAAVKIGMLGSGEVAAAVADFLESFHPSNVVLDPVLRSSSGMELIDEPGVEVIRRRLWSLVDVITPNLQEAGLLADMPVRDLPSMKEAATDLLRLSTKAVVITGGHIEDVTDVLAESKPDGTAAFRTYTGEKVATANTHGTECAFSTSLACNLAHGLALPDAVQASKNYVAGALRNSYAIGRGVSPVNHLFRG